MEREDHITVDVDGSVYICDRLYGHKEFVLGKVGTDTLESIMQNKLIDPELFMTP